MSDKLTHIDEWTGEHRGITYSIKNWDNGGGSKNKWNYYIHFYHSLLNDEGAEAFNLPITQNFLNHPVYDDGPFTEKMKLHGGCSYFKKLDGIDDQALSYKIGCDYGHGFDQGRIYNKERLQTAAKNTIDAIWENYSQYLVAEDGLNKSE